MAAKGWPSPTSKNVKVTVGTSVTPFARKAPAGRAVTGEKAAVNRDSIKGQGQTPKKYLKPSGSARKRAAMRAMPSPTHDTARNG